MNYQARKITNMLLTLTRHPIPSSHETLRRVYMKLECMQHTSATNLLTWDALRIDHWIVMSIVAHSRLGSPTNSFGIDRHRNLLCTHFGGAVAFWGGH